MPLKVGPFYLGPPSTQERAAAEASSSSLPFNFPHVGITRTAPPLPEAVAAEGWTLDHNRVQVGQGRQAYRKAQRLLQQWRHFDLGWASVNAPPLKQGAPVVVTAQTLFCWTCNPLRISFVEECGLRRGQLPPWAGARAASPLEAAVQAAAPGLLWPSKQQGGGSGGSSKGSSGGGGLFGGSGRQAEAQQQQQQQAARLPPPARGRRYAFAHTTLQGHQISGEERFAVAWNQDDDSVWYEIYTLSRPGNWITVLTRPLLRAFQHKFAADSMAAMQREMRKP